MTIIPKQTCLFDPFNPVLTDQTRKRLLNSWPGMNVHYALNLEPVAQELSIRTLERYIVLFETDDLAKKVMHDVTTRLVDLLALRIDQQRLDSTHVFSDMAQFGRTRLMGVAIKRFLTQVKNHAPQDYQVLDETLRSRYTPSAHQLFADTAKVTEARRKLPAYRRQAVGRSGCHVRRAQGAWLPGAE